MPHFRVELCGSIYCYADVTVKAATKEAAEDLAVQMAMAGQVNWTNGDQVNDIDSQHVQETDPVTEAVRAVVEAKEKNDDA